MDLEAYFKKISYVDQSPYLIDDNLKNNITCEAEFDQKVLLINNLSLVNDFVSDINLNLNKILVKTVKSYLVVKNSTYQLQEHYTETQMY